MQERKLESQFRDTVRREIGGMTIKLAPTEKGVPDRLVILPGGRIELVELKAEGGRISPSQAHWHARAASLGVCVTVLTGGPEIAAWGRARSEAHGGWIPQTPESAPAFEELDQEALAEAGDILESIVAPYEGYKASNEELVEISIRGYNEARTGLEDPKLARMLRER